MKYTLANANKKAIGGPNTRYCSSGFHDISKRSCLDLCIVSKSLVKYFDEFVVDDKLKFTPGYAVGGRIQYSDHFSLLITFKGIPLKKGNINTVHTERRWNTNRKGGWCNYCKMTDHNYKFQEIVEKGERKSNDMIDKEICKELTKTKFKCFGKVKPSKFRKESPKLKELKEKKDKLIANEGYNEEELETLEQEIVQTIKREQNKILEKEIINLENISKKKGKAVKVFKLMGE